MGQAGRIVALLAWCAALAACSSLPRAALTAPTAPNASAVPTAPATPTSTVLRGADLPLLSPASLGGERQAQQILRGEYDGHEFSLRCVVSVDAGRLTVIGVNALGLRAFTLSYDGAQLNEQRAPQVPDALRAANLLNDLQFVLWPLPVLQQAWRTAGVEVTEPYPGTRRLQRQGQLLAEAHLAGDAWRGRVWLRHLDIPYSLFIDSSAPEGGP